MHIPQFTMAASEKPSNRLDVLLAQEYFKWRMSLRVSFSDSVSVEPANLAVRTSCVWMTGIGRECQCCQHSVEIFMYALVSLPNTGSESTKFGVSGRLSYNDTVMAGQLQLTVRSQSPDTPGCLCCHKCYVFLHAWALKPCNTKKPQQRTGLLNHWQILPLRVLTQT